MRTSEWRRRAVTHQTLPKELTPITQCVVLLRPKDCFFQTMCTHWRCGVITCLVFTCLQGQEPFAGRDFFSQQMQVAGTLWSWYALCQGLFYFHHSFQMAFCPSPVHLFSILNKCVVISCCRAGTGGSTHSVSLRLGSWCLKASTKSVSSFGKYVIYICLKTRQRWSAIKAHFKNYIKLLFFI